MDPHDTKSADGLTRFSSGIEAVLAFPTTPVNATRFSRHGRTDGFLPVVLQALNEFDLDFDIDITGFETVERLERPETTNRETQLSPLNIHMVWR